MYYLNSSAPAKSFRMVLQDDIYVDKSLLIEKISQRIGKGNRYICITRPRRFGKSINANMLAAYYTHGLDCHPLFDRLLIARTEGYEKNLNRYNVIFIDFSRMPDTCTSYQEYLTAITDSLRSDLQEAYPHVNGRSYPSLSMMLAATGDSFLFILDEWDAVFHRDFMSQKDRIRYMEFLKGLLKDQAYVEMAYMTGVLPIARYSSGSALNMFLEFNFLNDGIFDSYFGFTGDEVKALCQKHSSVSYETIQYWYDGYYTGDGQSLFNPSSVNLALSFGRCRNYWTETGPMNEIAECIEHNVDEVREDIVQMVAGNPIDIRLSGYTASDLRLDSRDEILSAMTVFGFLSYHDQSLRIPNHELMEKFQQVLSRESMGEIRTIVSRSKEMLEATLCQDAPQVAAILEETHDREIPFLQYNDENSLSCVVTLCYLYARNYYRIEREAKSGKGYCDYLFIPIKNTYPAIILELKCGGSCKDAIRQIRTRNYAQTVLSHSEILLVGISYDKTTKKHSCMIEKY